MSSASSRDGLLQVVSEQRKRLSDLEKRLEIAAGGKKASISRTTVRASNWKSSYPLSPGTVPTPLANPDAPSAAPSNAPSERPAPSEQVRTPSDRNRMEFQSVQGSDWLRNQRQEVQSSQGSDSLRNQRQEVHSSYGSERNQVHDVSSAQGSERLQTQDIQSSHGSDRLQSQVPEVSSAQGGDGFQTQEAQSVQGGEQLQSQVPEVSSARGSERLRNWTLDGYSSQGDESQQRSDAPAEVQHHGRSQLQSPAHEAHVQPPRATEHLQPYRAAEPYSQHRRATSPNLRHPRVEEQRIQGHDEFQAPRIQEVNAQGQGGLPSPNRQGALDAQGHGGLPSPSIQGALDAQGQGGLPSPNIQKVQSARQDCLLPPSTQDVRNSWCLQSPRRHDVQDTQHHDEGDSLPQKSHRSYPSQRAELQRETVYASAQRMEEPATAEPLPLAADSPQVSSLMLGAQSRPVSISMPSHAAPSYHERVSSPTAPRDTWTARSPTQRTSGLPEAWSGGGAAPAPQMPIPRIERSLGRPSGISLEEGGSTSAPRLPIPRIERPRVSEDLARYQSPASSVSHRSPQLSGSEAAMGSPYQPPHRSDESHTLSRSTASHPSHPLDPSPRIPRDTNADRDGVVCGSCGSSSLTRPRSASVGRPRASSQGRATQGDMLRQGAPTNIPYIPGRSSLWSSDFDNILARSSNSVRSDGGVRSEGSRSAAGVRSESAGWRSDAGASGLRSGLPDAPRDPGASSKRRSKGKAEMLPPPLGRSAGAADAPRSSMFSSPAGPIRATYVPGTSMGAPSVRHTFMDAAPTARTAPPAPYHPIDPYYPQHVDPYNQQHVDPYNQQYVKPNNQVDPYNPRADMYRQPEDVYRQPMHDDIHAQPQDSMYRPTHEERPPIPDSPSRTFAEKAGQLRAQLQSAKSQYTPYVK